MSDALVSRFNVTADDLRRYDWQARLEKHPCKECHSFFSVFAASAKEYEDAGDDLGRRVHALLHVVASFHANYDTKGNPYDPLWRNSDGSRALMAEDLTDADLDALSGILDEIKDPEFRARVADILWECRRDHKAAQKAVRAFLESAERLKTDDLWPPYTDRLERAAHLAAKLGFGKALHQEVLGVVEAAIREFENNSKSGLLCVRLMMTALAHGASDTARYAALAERLANDFAAAGNLDFSEHYWHCAESWHREAKNESEIRRCQLGAAECLIAKGEKGIEARNLGLGYAAHWMGRGLEGLRQARADATRIKEVHVRFLELQHQALSELSPMEFDPQKFPGFQEAEKTVQEGAIAHVRGFGFEEAVARLVHVSTPTNTATLRTQIEDQSDGLIFDKIVSTVALDHSGKVADMMPPVGFGPSGIEEDAMRKKMVQQAKQILWQMQVVWKIEPARMTIVSEHGIRRRDLVFLVTGNPFIPRGHEGIYLRGLQAGFFGDWLTAMHLLIPQIEASLRYVLQQNGIVTSTLEADGTQKERDLNQLLWMPDIDRIFGKDIAFDLRGILIERFGFNMRNESAHGLMPEGAFYSFAPSYLWWLVLRLGWAGYALIQSSTNETMVERESTKS